MNQMLLNHGALVDVTPLVELNGVLVQLCDNGVCLALMASGVSGCLPMVVITHTTLPNSTGPILLLIMLPAVAKGMIYGASMSQASKIPDGDAVL
jgi:hypothetical protein